MVAYLLQLLQRLLLQTSFLKVVLSSSDDLVDDLGVDCALYRTVCCQRTCLKGQQCLHSQAPGTLTTAAFDILSTDINFGLYQELLEELWALQDEESWLQRTFATL
jgi:hypothetical protein